MENFELIMIYAFVVVQFSMFAIVYFIISTSQKNLYHTLYAEKQKMINEDAERQRKKIIDVYKTQLSIRQLRSTLAQASISSEIDTKELKKAHDRLQEEYTSKNLAAVADFEKQQGHYEKALEYINKAIDIDFEQPELWKAKADLLSLLERSAEEQEAKKRYLEFLGIAKFQKNLLQKISLEEIEFRNLAFFGSFIWKLNPKINVLLGKNGYGKSHLLSIVLAQLQEESTGLINLTRTNNASTVKNQQRSFLKIKMNGGESLEPKRLKSLKNELVNLIDQRAANSQPEATNENSSELDTELEKKYDEFERLSGRSMFEAGIIQSTFGKIPVLAIPDLRFINKSGESTYTVTDEKAKKILEYGAYHFINQAPYESAIQNFLNTLCNIYYKDLNTFRDDIFILIRRTFQTLSGNDFRWNKIEPTQDNSGNLITVMTEGNNEPLPIQKVSQGTLSILSIIGVIFHYMGLRYPDVPRNKITKQHAIVFIDEIDAHLHPSWQRKLIGIMRREFPNVQFIITAHSPLIVAGCKEDEVAVMREVKIENDFAVKGFVVEKVYQDFIGYSADEIYNKIFEIEERDENYQKYISLIAGKSEIETQVKQLEEAKTEGGLSSSDQSKLSEMQEDLYYIEKAKEKMDSILDVERTKLENQRLKMELEIHQENSQANTSGYANA